MASKTEPQPTKKVNPVEQMERERAGLIVQIDGTRSRIQTLQQELATILAVQRGAAKHRAPLEQAAQAAQAARRDAEEALARHLGGANEEAFADKLYECSEVAKKAQADLVAFDKQYQTVGRQNELRASIQQSQEALHEIEQRQMALTHELDQAIAHERVIALRKLLNAYLDLYTVLEAEGSALARMRLIFPEEYRSLMAELPIDQETLFAMIATNWTGDGSNRRPILEERQSAIRERLAKLT